MKKIVLLSVLLAASGCEVGTNPGTPGDPDGGGGGGPDGSMMSGPDAWKPPPPDPFDPANACGVSTVPTQQVPGSLLIVFDRSGSMDNPVRGDTGPTKWDLAKVAINNALSASGDELSAGLLLFPGSGNCGVPGAPEVPVAPLSTSRPMIQSALNSATPSGGSTPAFAALRAGYDHLDTLTTPGQRGIVLVTDGGETCEQTQADRDAIFARVAMERSGKNRLTFAVGLAHTDRNLSNIAYNGGTGRSPTCEPECTTNGSCRTDADCGGAPCNSLGQTIGICTCENDSHCPAAQTCEMTDPFTCNFFPSLCMKQCAGPANCCHYDASDASFQSDFENALREIARRLVDSCVFEVPRGTDPSMFDPARVNVGVTFEGEDRTVLRRGYDPNVDSWNYTDDTYESLIIQGPICDRILEGEPATVEIVLGCPTIII